MDAIYKYKFLLINTPKTDEEITNYLKENNKCQ
jgi:hypothetical protein